MLVGASVVFVFTYSVVVVRRRRRRWGALFCFVPLSIDGEVCVHVHPGEGDGGKCELTYFRTGAEFSLKGATQVLM